LSRRVWLAAALLLSGCKSEVGVCKVDGDCPSPQRCVASACSTATASASVVADENDPRTHTARLSDPAKRDAAVDAIARLVEAVMAQDAGDPGGPHAAPLLDAVVGPLASVAKTAKLDSTRQAKVLRLLAQSRHRGAEDALVEAIRLHRVDGKQPTPVDRVMGEVVAAAADMNLSASAPALWTLFQALHASSRKAEVGGFSGSLASAVARLAMPAWAGNARKLLAAPLDPEGDLKRFRDQLYWQKTAALVLGRLRDAGAVEALMKVGLDPQKHDMGPEVLSALTRIGTPASEIAKAVLASEHESLLAHAADRYRNAREKDVADVVDRGADGVRITFAVQVLAAVGRSADATTLLDGLERADPIGRGRIAAMLFGVPKTAETLDAFKKVVKTSPLDLPVADAHRGVAALYAVVPYWLEPSLVPWLAELAAGLSGSDTGLAPFRDAALRACMTAMTQAQLGAVQPLADLITKEKWDKDWAAAASALDTCSEDAACWLKRISRSPDGKSKFSATKAAVMTAMFAEPSHVDAMVTKLGHIRALEPRRMLVLGLGRLHPSGDDALAARVEKALTIAGMRDPVTARAVARLVSRTE
jgi:hypothetical protein